MFLVCGHTRVDRPSPSTSGKCPVHRPRPNVIASRARRRCLIVCWRCTASTVAVSSKCSMIRPFPSANNSNQLSQRVHLGPNVDGSPNGSNFGRLLCPSISAKVSDCVPALTKCLFILVATVRRMARYYELNTPIELGNSLYFTCHI